MALLGEDDYVPTSPNVETIVVKGGHISPLENSEEILKLINLLSI